MPIRANHDSKIWCDICKIRFGKVGAEWHTRAMTPARWIVISLIQTDRLPSPTPSDWMDVIGVAFGNIVSRLGTVTLTGNAIVSNWEDIVDNWNALTSSFGSNLPINASVFSGFYFDTAASERLVIAVNEPGAAGATRRAACCARC